MRFRIKKGRHLNNEGEIYETTIVEKKLNGYKVLNPENNVNFIALEDIEILELSDIEKNMSITL